MERFRLKDSSWGSVVHEFHNIKKKIFYISEFIPEIPQDSGFSQLLIAGFLL
jgi:hypothetical protein